MGRQRHPPAPHLCLHSLAAQNEVGGSNRAPCSLGAGPGSEGRGLPVTRKPLPDLMAVRRDYRTHEALHRLPNLGGHQDPNSEDPRVV